MFEKVNPYLKEELNEQAAAHLCGCRCASNTDTINSVILSAIKINSCDNSCVGQTNYEANYIAAYNDRHWTLAQSHVEFQFLLLLTSKGTRGGEVTCFLQ